MKLVERGASDLPVRLLVQVAQGHGIGEQLVELFGDFQADGVFEFQMKRVGHGTVGLYLAGLLVNTRFGCKHAMGSGRVLLRHSNDLLISYRQFREQNCSSRGWAPSLMISLSGWMSRRPNAPHQIF